MVVRGRCQIPTCPHKAKYGLFWTVQRVKKWVYVCGFHERSIGDENERRAIDKMGGI